LIALHPHRSHLFNAGFGTESAELSQADVLRTVPGTAGCPLQRCMTEEPAKLGGYQPKSAIFIEN
jgi:hypothetical protein